MFALGTTVRGRARTVVPEPNNHRVIRHSQNSTSNENVISRYPLLAAPEKWAAQSC